MAKSNKPTPNVMDNQTPINEVEANTEQTKEVINENKEAQIPPIVEQAGGDKGDSEQGKNSENSELDNQTEEKGIGEQGSDIGSEIDKADAADLNPKYARIAADIFKKNRGTVLFFTSDDMPFWAENDAIRHAAKLADKSIVEITKQ